MSLIPDRYVCVRCDGYDLPIGARMGLSSECSCGASVYEGDDRQGEHEQRPGGEAPEEGAAG